MRSIVGSWTLMSETANDSAGEPVAFPYGGAPVGSATFTAEGRVVAVLIDGRMNGGSEPRPLTAFCGRIRSTEHGL
jgi:Lipocalin-like domain